MCIGVNTAESFRKQQLLCKAAPGPEIPGNNRSQFDQGTNRPGFFLNNSQIAHSFLNDQDVPRTFSSYRRMSSPEGLKSLRRVLLAFAYFNPVVGYCQGLGYSFTKNAFHHFSSVFCVELFSRIWTRKMHSGQWYFFSREQVPFWKQIISKNMTFFNLLFFKNEASNFSFSSAPLHSIFAATFLELVKRATFFGFLFDKGEGVGKTLLYFIQFCAKKK